MKTFGDFLGEAAPTNSVGNGGYTNASSNPLVTGGFDKTILPYAITNAYQTPMDLSYRWSNVFPVQKLSLEDIEGMVDASNEFINVMNRSTLTKKDYFRFINEAKEAKTCPAGKYWCFTDKKCKSIPSGYHIGRRGYLEQDQDEDGKNGSNNGNGNGNGHSGNGNGGNGNGGGGNGGGGE